MTWTHDGEKRELQSPEEEATLQISRPESGGSVHETDSEVAAIEH
jgi:hypothetical protein